MPDIISRIKLESEGMQRVRNDIDQLKKTLLEAGQAAQGMSTSLAGPTDPFARATAPPLYGPTGQLISGGGLPALVPGMGGGGGGQFFFIEAAKEQRRNEEHNRIAQSGGGILSAIRMFQGTTASIANADLLGAAQGGQGILSQLKGFSPVAGAAVIAAGIATGGIALGWKELERMNELGPLAQRLGGNYWGPGGVREGMFEGLSAMKGLRPETLRGVAEGMAQAGIGWDKAGPINTQNALIAEKYGMDPAVLGRAMGVSIRAGGKGEAEPTARILASAFGVGRLSEAFQGVAGILEEALARGARRGSETLQEGMEEGLATRIAQLQAQGYDLPGAIRIAGQVWSGARNIANVEQPVDVAVLRRFMAANPEMSLGQAQAALETDPARAAAYAVGTARIMSGGTPTEGGNRELQARFLSRALRLTMGQTYSFMAALETKLPPGAKLPEIEKEIILLRSLKGGVLQAVAGLEGAPVAAITAYFEGITKAGDAVRSGVEAASDAIKSGVEKVGDAIEAFGEEARKQIEALKDNTDALRNWLNEPYTAPPSKDKSPTIIPRRGVPYYVPRSGP